MTKTFLVTLGLLVLRHSAAEGVSYLEAIKPVLKERCYACHGALKQKAGLRLDTAANIHKGGTDGGVISEACVCLLLRA